MATTINAATIKVPVDVSQLSKLGFARKEINEITRTVGASKDKFEEYRRQVDNLRKAYQGGAISADAFARATEHLKSKLPNTEFQQFVGRFGGMIAGAASVAGVRQLAHGFASTVEEIDRVGDEAAKAGIAFNDLLIMQRSLSEVGGISSDQVTEGLKKMMLNLGKAAEDGGDLAIELKRMGLSVKEVSNAGAVNAFKEISRSFSSISGHAEKMRVAQVIFGKAGIDMVPALERGEDAIEGMADHLERAGLLIGDQMADQVGKMADDMQRMSDYLTGMQWGATVAAMKDLQNIGKLTPEVSAKDWGTGIYQAFASAIDPGGQLQWLSFLGSRIPDTEKKSRVDELMDREAEIGKEKSGSTLPKALQAGSAEAYKFLAQGDKERADREMQTKKLDDIRRELAEINRKDVAIIGKAR